jgi:aminoglycoside phosphotransferase (APT) family kinase protein
MINEKALKAYLKDKFNVSQVEIKRLGSGVQGSGFLVELRTRRGTESYVIKSLVSEGFGHDYPSDRAAVFLLDLDEFNTFPAHVKAIDVLAEMADGSVKSVGGGREYYLLMEQGKGIDYFRDLNKLSQKNRLEKSDIEKIKALTSYLARVHGIKKDSRTLYWRKLRDTIGHGECLMGILDLYPTGILSDSQMKDIIKKAIDWNYELKPKFRRLSQIHGDFHPGNIWFENSTDFILLDRSRGPWGEPADDITALTINYIFFSVKYHGMVKGPYLEALNLFYEDYIRLSGDEEINSVVQLFYAFRGVVIANPVFYPDLSHERRLMIFRFINNVLNSDRFDTEKLNEYLR